LAIALFSFIPRAKDPGSGNNSFWAMVIEQKCRSLNWMAQVCLQFLPGCGLHYFHSCSIGQSNSPTKPDNGAGSISHLVLGARSHMTSRGYGCIIL
jgi:hypothetical protein